MVGTVVFFFFTVVEEDTDFNIYWIFEQSLYRCDEPALDFGVNCYIVNGRTIVLQINTTSLDPGFHPVQCILQPIIDSKYTSDPSFLPQYGCNISRVSTLEIIDPCKFRSRGT